METGVKYPVRLYKRKQANDIVSVANDYSIRNDLLLTIVVM